MLKLRDKDIYLNEGEFFVVPKGVEHLPIAEEEAHVLFIEPKSNLNTGNVQNERTVSELGYIKSDVNVYLSTIIDEAITHYYEHVFPRN